MRKKLILPTICMFLAMSVPAWAQTGKATVLSQSGHESHAGHDAAKPAPPPAAAQSPGHDHGAGMDKDAQAMDVHMQKMRAHLEKMKATTDPAERQKLMQEHLASMREGMKMMKEAPGGQMMAGGMKGGKSGKMEMKQMGMGPMMMRHQSMEKKMEMMQVMLEGLIEALPLQGKP